jgi:hypothetical protein
MDLNRRIKALKNSSALSPGYTPAINLLFRFTRVIFTLGFRFRRLQTTHFVLVAAKQYGVLLLVTGQLTAQQTQAKRQIIGTANPSKTSN